MGMFAKDEKETAAIKLTEAIRNHNGGDVRGLVKSGAVGVDDPITEDGRTALMVAATDGIDAMVQILVEFRANVNATDNAGWTPLHLVVSRGMDNSIRLLLESGADVNKVSNSGVTPLSVAVSRANEGAVKKLLAAGANPSLRGSVGVSALEQARKDGSKELERLMMNALPEQDGGGVETMFMARKGQESFQFVRPDGRVLTLRRSSVPDEAFLVADSAEIGDEMGARMAGAELVSLENKTVSNLGAEFARKAAGIDDGDDKERLLSSKRPGLSGGAG